MKLRLTNIIVLLILFFSAKAVSQKSISGKVTSTLGVPLPAVTIWEQDTNNAVLTDFEGKFSIIIQQGSNIEVRYLGYDHQVISTDNEIDFHIILNREETLDEVVIIGNPSRPRTILDSPVPIDNIKAQELKFTGQSILEDMLTFAVPSYFSQNHPISDGTAHYDPADLRGLGPSRTLVLINGKRKGQSAQVLLSDTPGKGDVGVDMKTIPLAAIERVEILRDGASAQYGSDAIAGVMNIILKEDAEFSTLNASTGISSQGDGFNLNLDFNHTFHFGNDGSLNVTLARYLQETSNRAGAVGIQDVVEFHEGLPSEHPEYNNPRQYELEWARKNPQLGMTYGQPQMDNVSMMVHLIHDLGPNAELYSIHGHTFRYGKSFAFYRAPYWRKDVADSGLLAPIHDTPEFGGNGNGIRDRDENGNYTEPIFTLGDYIGYQPTFETQIKDNFNVLGIDFEFENDLSLDMSVAHGNNQLEYYVNHSINRDYLRDRGTSPHNFYNGGYLMRHYSANLDFVKLIGPNISVTWGGEFRKELFSTILGDPFSHYEGGSDSFEGIAPEILISVQRNNVAAYGSFDYERGHLLLGIAGRFEDYTDFGNNFSWKANARLKLGNQGAVRTSYSTGFRAPSLHQRHLQSTKYTIVANSPFPVLQGTLPNDHPVVKGLGVESLFEETSNNIAWGITYRFNRHLSASLDLYQINVNDRILFSSQISAVDGLNDGLTGEQRGTIEPIETILIENGVEAIQFFLNAGNTQTTGADLVLNINDVFFSSTLSFGAVLAGNINATEIQSIDTPDFLEQNDYIIFDKEQSYLITDSRPKSKFILGLHLESQKFRIGLTNTHFGPVTIAGLNGGTDQKLSSKVLSDINLLYRINNNLQFNFFVNNLFDIYPDKTLRSTGTPGGGTRFPWIDSVTQVGILGLNFTAGLNYRF
ncbi:MAG: TonB-dependent receptor [Flavobacteriaceae bacterium]|nr:TonB-dependent receptor [Flavobacteriaceae bacterium]